MANITPYNILKDKIKELYESEINNILELINQEYKKEKKTELFNFINKTNIIEKWKSKLEINLNNFEFLKNINNIDNIDNKNKKKRPINPINYCYARKPNLKRCTRNKKKNSDYCASHQFNLLYGRIDQEIDENIKNLNKNKTKSLNNHSKESKIHKIKNVKPKEPDHPKIINEKNEKNEKNEQNEQNLKNEQNVKNEQNGKNGKNEQNGKNKKTKQIILTTIKIDDNSYLIDKENFIYISEIVDNKTKYRNIGKLNKHTNKIESIVNTKNTKNIHKENVNQT